MARQIPQDRFSALVEAGTAIFVAQGYRRTQMQDVADALGVSKGTVYAAVASKEALLNACVRFADGLETPPDASSWPLPTPGSHDLVDLVTARLSEVSDLALHQVEDVLSGSASEEFELILTDLIRRLARHRHAIKLVDRCAAEIPDLAQLWFGAGRAGLVDQLRDHLDRRAAQGLLWPSEVPGDSDVVARTIVETCVMWSVHLRWDPAPSAFRTDRSDDDLARILSRLFARGIVIDPPPDQAPDPR